jgi:small-conductance mechanosensitive channel/CRP-like cAMP-binding protein
LEYVPSIPDEEDGVTSTTMGFRFEIALCVGGGLLFGLLLRALRPHDRASIRNTLMLLLAGALAEAVAPGLGAHANAAGRRIAANLSTFLVGLGLIRLLLLVLFRVLLPAARVHVVRLAEDLASAGVLLAWGFVCLGLAGADLGSLVTTSAVMTAVLAFSMQDTLGNLLGGIVLQLDGSMQVGDWVDIDGNVRGRVTDVRWRYTAIETRNRETVYVPNSTLIRSRFTVIGSRADTEMRWRRWLWFNVELDAPPRRVCAVLERAVQDAELRNVAREPGPGAVLMDVTEGCARYALRYWLTDPREDDGTDSIVRAHALAALERAGIRIGVRREERLVLAQDEARRHVLAAEEEARRLSALDRLPLFAALSDEEKHQVARHLVHAPFLAGDVVTRKGAVAHWLYLIISGEAEICDERDDTRVRVAMLGPGEVFGERGLLTGEPRAATVVARTDLECYRLDKPGLEGVMHARPDIAEEMSRILAARAAELDAMRTAAALDGSQPVRHLDLLARIRGFFGLNSTPARPPAP